jgi:hypothetical protein
VSAKTAKSVKGGATFKPTYTPQSSDGTR